MQDKAHPSGPMHWTRGVRYVVPEGYTCIATEKKQEESDTLTQKTHVGFALSCSPFLLCSSLNLRYKAQHNYDERCDVSAVQRLLFPHRIASDTTPQLLEDFPVHLAEHDGAVHLTSLELRELGKSATAILVILGKDRDCHEHFICMQTRIVSAQIFNLCLLNRLNHALGDEIDIVRDACQMLGGIEQESCAAT